MRTIKIPYWMRNDGAGGCILSLEPTLGQAECEEEKESEPFGEPTASTIDLTLHDDGRVTFRDYRDVSGGGDGADYQWVEVEIPQERP